MTTAMRAALTRGRLFLLQILIGKGGVDVMAMFFAQRVILGKTEYAAVPATLKPQVRELLEESGLGDLAVEETI